MEFWWVSNEVDITEHFDDVLSLNYNYCFKRELDCIIYLLVTDYNLLFIT